MVFASNAFLFFFLPITLILYYLARKKRAVANAVLTVLSLLFYAWGEPRFVLIMLLSIVINWLCALGIEALRNKSGKGKLLLIVAVTVNVALLGVFKYADFAIGSVNSLLGVEIPLTHIALPIGISFFTFQAMSYVIDVYRGKGQAQRNLGNVCLYISFFPQLIAGPIVRYETVAGEIQGRTETREDFYAGARRFMVGYAKKALLANAMGKLVDYVFALPGGEMTVSLSWLGAACYLIQVYYDFSGYSDMAIGLGRMFGFHFLENFNFPFIAKSVTEFWRRWHISMCTWFRDYVFFPLGGSRVKSKWRLAFNMLAVWILTGLWHGADWTYVCWGLLFFAVLLAEKLTGLGKWMEKHKIGHLYAMALVTLITVLIRSSSISSAFSYIKTMFGFGGSALFDRLTWFLIKEYLWYIVAAVVCSLPLGAFIRRRLRIPEGVWEIACGVAIACVMLAAVANTSATGYNPFIYYNF
ncbi:MAG: MBOAT family protein [Clostridiales bacterium]|nr:MBOAT family protein [Clostridiales bacterium]